MKVIYSGILWGTLAIFFLQCAKESNCGSAGVCEIFPKHSLELVKPQINRFLAHCTIGSEKTDLQPVADWLENESCILSANVLDSCLYSNPAICFIEVVFTDQERTIIAFSMTSPITVRGFE